MTAVDAMNELVSHHLPLARRMARKIARRLPPTVMEDDLIGAAYVGLFNAARSYQPERGEFSRFASFYVTGAVYDWLREVNGTRKKQRLMLVSLESPVAADERCRLKHCLAGKHEGEMEARETLEHLGQPLDLRQRLVLKLLSQGFQQKEIAWLLMVSRSRVSQLLHEEILPQIAERVG